MRSLFVTNSEIVDLSPIAEIEGIRLIELTGSKVTDLTPLQYLPNFNYLNVHRTRLTDKLVDDFARANPGCGLSHPAVQTELSLHSNMIQLSRTGVMFQMVDR